MEEEFSRVSTRVVVAEALQVIKFEALGREALEDRVWLGVREEYREGGELLAGRTLSFCALYHGVRWAGMLLVFGWVNLGLEQGMSGL